MKRKLSEKLRRLHGINANPIILVQEVESLESRIKELESRLDQIKELFEMNRVSMSTDGTTCEWRNLTFDKIWEILK